MMSLTSSSGNLAARVQVERERRRRERERSAELAALALPAFAGATMIEVPHGESTTIVPFSLWPEQRRVVGLMVDQPLLVVLKARQLGISWLVCLYVLWMCVTRANTTILMFSQGQVEANELIRRIGFLQDHHARRALFPRLIKDNTEELGWSNGSRVISLPATRKAGRSFTASAIVLDEFAFMQFGADLFAAAKPTIDDGGKMFVISSADGAGTPYHRFWQAAARGANGFLPVFLPWQANPNRGPDWRERKFAEAFNDPAQVRREYPENDIEAFTNASGLVFDVWSDGPADGNVVDAADFEPGAGPVIWAVDDGYAGGLDRATGHFTAESHPRAFLLVQQKPDGHLDVFAESYAAKKLSDEHIAEVKAMTGPDGKPYPAADYAIIGPGFAELSGRLFAAEIYSRKVQADVEETIKEARRALAPDEKGWRRIRVHPRCRHLRAELASYRRDAGTSKVVKQHDHGPDALRYLAWEKRHGG